MADNIKKIIEIEYSINNGPMEKFKGSVEDATKKIEDLEKATATIKDATLNLDVKADGITITTEELKILTEETNNAADAGENLGATSENTAKKQVSLKQELKQVTQRMQELQLAGEQTSQEYQNLAARSGEIKDAFEEVGRATAANKSSADAFIGTLSGAAGAFAAAQGAAGLFGSESENVQKALLKVQSALAIVQGVEAFKDSIPSIKAFGAALKGAIGASGIGLLIVALGAIVAYWDDIKGAISGVSSEQSKAVKGAAEFTAKQEHSLKVLNSSDEILKSQGKSEDEILGLKIKQTKAVIDARKQELLKNQAMRKSQIEAAERNQKILQGIIRFISAPLTILLTTVDRIGKALGYDFGLEEKFSGGISKLLFDPEQIKKDGEKADQEAKDQITELENTQAGYENTRKANRKKSAEEAAKKAKEYNDKLKDIQIKHNEEMLRLEKEQQDNLNKLAEINAETNLEKEDARLQTVLDNLKSSQAKELAAIAERETALAKLKAQSVKKNDPAIIAAEKALGEERKAITDKYNTSYEIAWKEHGDNVNNIIRQNAIARAKLRSELNGQTDKEALDELNAANNAEFEALKLAGLTEEDILKLFAQRRAKLKLDQAKETNNIDADKDYFTKLKALYDDNTLSEEQRNKKIEALNNERLLGGYDRELKANEAEMKLYDKNSEKYKALEEKNTEIAEQQSKARVDIAKKERDEKISAAEKWVNKALELANALADLANAILEAQTKRVEDEYEKQRKAKEDENTRELSNIELTDSQKEELQRQHDIELQKLEEDKQAKLKDIKKKQADIDFAITVAEIIATTALQVIKTAANPVMAVIIAAIGAAQIGIAVAQRQAVQGLARGGMVYGSGGPTEDNIPIMASNGEAVINARAVSKFAPVLSAINQSTGGAPIRPRFAAGGIVTANPGEVSVSNIGDIAAVAGQNAVRAYILESDVTSQSVKNQRIIRNSRIK